MNYNYTISIKNNSNKIIGSSTDKFSGISSGSLIKLENNPSLYTVLNKESFFYIRDFKSSDSKIIEIDDFTDINLQKNDTLRITFKEYEAKFLVNIVNKGTGYVVGSKVRVVGGVLSFDMSIGAGDPSIFEITEVDGENKVESVGMVSPGKYISPPISPSETSCERGDGLILDIKYAELGNRSFLERTIIDIYFKDNKTYIVLDYSLPLNLTCGKISCEKNTLILSSNYTGETQRNLSYETFSNFTPNIKLPMLLKNSMSQDAVFNKACLILDEEIGKIKKHLGIK